LADWLQSLRLPVGIFACNDERASDVVESCMLAGLRIPEDIAVLGVDNDDFVCEMSDAPISSIELNVQQAGYEAAQLLDKMMKDNERINARVMVEPTRVVVRHSTDILAVEDIYVRDAIKFISQHIHEPIQVTDVAGAVGLSRTVLYEKFQRFLGYSAHQYIKRMRTEEMARLLVESEMSISEIALAMGFTGEDHIAEYFRKHKGMNPSKYRRKFGY
jgi:LacI family transcriptional regulator